MDKVDSLIKMLAEFKEELNKNMNSSYGSTDQNMAKDAPDANATADIVRPDAGYGKVTVKDTTPKPADPKRPYGKVIMKDEQQDQPKVNLNNPYNDQDEDKEKKKLKKASKDPALAPKEVKIKELQGKIDAGTYKPDAKKIADKMLKKTPNDASAAAPPANGVPEMAKDEPHKDDPKHEVKEKVKVKNIKEEAEEILDMHKEECTFAKNGQWSLKKGTWREDQRAKEPMDMSPSPAEKNMPLNPTKPKAVDKPMGANKKPVLASRHKTNTPKSDKDFDNSIQSTPVPEELKEELSRSENGQWDVKKWNMEKRCWEGYESTPGKKAYSDDSCRPIKKEESEVAPKGSNNKKTFEESFAKSEELAINEFEITEWDNGDIDIIAGEAVPEKDFNFLCKSVCEKADCEEMDKKEWSPKAEHKSDKGGLTAAGRKSYNKETGGNLKAPQPGGGPRKKSFCARNGGQIKMHNIDCKATPDKRACKARRRWKC